MAIPARSSLARSRWRGVRWRGVRWRGVPAAAAAGCWYIINWAAGMGLQPKARSRAAGMGLQPKARSRWRGVVGAEFRLQPRRLLVWGCSRRRGVRWRGVPAAAAAGCWYIINWAAGMGLLIWPSRRGVPARLAPPVGQRLARSRWRGVPAAAAAAAGMGLQPKARSSLARSSGCSRRRGVRWRGVVGAESLARSRAAAEGAEFVGAESGCWYGAAAEGAEFVGAESLARSRWRGVPARLAPPVGQRLARSSLARSSLARSSGCSRRRGVGLLVWPSRRGVPWRGVPAAAAAGCWYGHPGAEFVGAESLARSSGCSRGGCWYGAAAEGAEFVGAEFRLQQPPAAGISLIGLLVWGCSRRRGVGLLVWGCSRRRGVGLLVWPSRRGVRWRGVVGAESGCSRRRGVGLLVWPSRRGVRWRGVPAAAAAGCWYGAADMAIPARSSGAPCPTGGATIGAESLARSSGCSSRRLLVWGCSRRRGVRWRGVPAAAAAGCWYIINWAAGMGLQPKARSSLARSSLARSSLARSRWRGVVGAEFRLQPRRLLVWPSRRGVRWRGVVGAEFVGAESLARSSLARSSGCSRGGCWYGAAAEGAESGCWYGHPGAEFVGAEFRLQQPPAAGISLIGLLVWGCSRRRGVGLLVWGCSRRRGVRWRGVRWRGVRWRGVPAAAAAAAGMGLQPKARSRAAGMAIPARSSLARSSGCSRRRGVRWRGVVGAESLARSRWRGVPAAAAAGCWYIINWAAGMGLQPKARSRWRGVPAAAEGAESGCWYGHPGAESLARSRWRGVVGAEFRLQQPPAAGISLIGLLVWGCSRRRGVVGAESLARSRWRGVPARLAPPVGQRLARSRWRGVVGAEFVGAEFVGAEFRLQQPPAAGISLIGLLVWGCSRRRGVGLLVWPSRRGVRWRGVVGAESLARSSGCSSRRLLVWPSRRGVRWRGVGLLVWGC